MPVLAVSPNAAPKPTAVNEPIMNTSPCAKLISSMMPYTSVYPIAIRAQIAPLDRPTAKLKPSSDRSWWVTWWPATVAW